MIKLQVRVLRLTKMYDYFNVPPVLLAHPVSFGFGTISIEFLDCELSENIYFYVCQMFIVKNMCC